MATVLLGKSNMNKDEIDQILLANNTVKNSEDETHTFLAFSNVSEDDTTMTTLESGLCHRSRKPGSSYCKMGSNNCVGLYMMLTMILMGVSILCLEVYRTHESYALRMEVDVLKKDVENLKHRLLEEDLLSELKAFKDAVYAEEATEDNEDDDDEYDYVEQEDPVNIVPEPHSRKYHTSSNSKYEQLQTDDNTIIEKHDHKHKSYDKKNTEVEQKPNEKRSKREVNNYEGGVPVIAESYGISNKTEGLRLYESLIANPQEITYETTENPIKEHHRISSSWPSKQHRKKYHAHRTHVSKDSGFSSRQRPDSTLPLSPIISRPSRVMQTDTDPSRRVKNGQPNLGMFSHTTAPPEPLTISEQRPNKKHEGEILVRVYQEQRAPPQSTIRAIDVLDAEGPRRRRRKPTRKLSSIETLEERTTPVAARHRLLPAAHYNGDTSHYSVQHEHYDGNGRLRHPDGVFADWTASKWVEQLGMERHFKLEGGVVTVKDTGLYFVYAQVHYLDEHDINGYRVYVNEEPMLQCTTMTHSVGRERVKKSNTCFTGAALFLRENDQLSLRDIGGLRYSLFETGKSFFGLIKLGSVNIK